MQHALIIQNIEELRRREGIDDVELRDQIRRLAVGDVIRLTFSTRPDEFTGATVPVRITRIIEGTFHGKLMVKLALAGNRKLPIGTAVIFTVGQIHSVTKAPSSLAHG